MFPSSLHVHTRYGDGENSPEEMIQAALSKGFVSVGLSEHAYAPYDPDCCIPADRMTLYREEVRGLAAKYAGQIQVYTGLEVDSHHLHDKAPWDFVIGSVHYVHSPRTGRYYTIDYLPSLFEEAVDDAGEGSVQAMLERYGASIAEMAAAYRPHILGHIDVVAKLNRGKRFFDPDSPWYRRLWESLTDAIAASGCIVEVNTGGMSRGYVDEPYPGRQILGMLKQREVPLTISSDAHDAASIDYAFPQVMEMLREIGYTSVKLMEGGVFIDYPLG